jgi:hypothetical protein
MSQIFDTKGNMSQIFDTKGNMSQIFDTKGNMSQIFDTKGNDYRPLERVSVRISIISFLSQALKLHTASEILNLDIFCIAAQFYWGLVSV